MKLPNALDEVAESQTLAAAGSTLASPLAEVAVTELPPVMPLEVPPEHRPATPAATLLPAAVQAAPLVTKPAEASTAMPLGTLPASATATLPMLGALLLVVALILLLGKLVKRVQGSKAGQAAALRIKGGVQIGARERVVWMQAGDTHLLLGVSPGRVQTLHVFDVAPDFNAAASETTPVAAAETPASKDFSERLKALLAHAQARGIAPAAVAAAAAKPAEAVASVAAKPQFSFRA